MAGAIASVYKFDSMIRALYIYETVWTPLIVMKCCECIMWEDIPTNMTNWEHMMISQSMGRGISLLLFTVKQHH